MSKNSEKYSSAAAKRKHEKSEGAKERKMEYGMTRSNTGKKKAKKKTK